MRLFSWLLALFLLLALLVGLTPLAAKWGLQNYLQRQGYQVDIRQLKINLFTGSIFLSGMDARHSQGDQLKVFEALAEMRWLPLFERRLVFNQLAFKGLEVDVRVDPQGLYLAGRTLADWLPVRADSNWSVAVDYLRLEDLTLCREQRLQCLRVESAGVSRSAWTQEDGGRQFEHLGPLVVERAYIRDQARNAAILYLGQLRVDRSNHLGERAQFGRIEISNFHFLENSLAGQTSLESPYLTQIGELSLTELTLFGGANPRIQAGDLVVTSWRQILYKGKDQRVLMPWHAWDLFPHTHPGALSALWRTPARQIGAASIELNSGALSWQDASVTPPAQVRMNRVQVRLGELNPDSPDHPTAVFVAARFDERGRLEWQGEAFLFRDSLDWKLSGFVHDLQMSSLAGYTEALFNQPVTGGMVDVSAQLAVQSGQLQAQSRWRLTDWRVTPGRSSGRVMPLEQTLVRLQDRNRAVEFNLPVTGDLGDQNFTLNYFFGTLMRQTLTDRARQAQPVSERPAEQVNLALTLYNPQ